MYWPNEKDWDGYDAEPPNKEAYVLLEEVLNYLQKIGIRPRRVAPSVVGGIGISLDNHYIEIYNEGGIAVLDKRDLEVTMIRSMKELSDLK